MNKKFYEISTKQIQNHQQIHEWIVLHLISRDKSLFSYSLFSLSIVVLLLLLQLQLIVNETQSFLFYSFFFLSFIHTRLITHTFTYTHTFNVFTATTAALFKIFKDPTPHLNSAIAIYMYFFRRRWFNSFANVLLMSKCLNEMVNEISIFLAFQIKYNIIVDLSKKITWIFLL